MREGRWNKKLGVIGLATAAVGYTIAVVSFSKEIRALGLRGFLIAAVALITGLGAMLLGLSVIRRRSEKQ